VWAKYKLSDLDEHQFTPSRALSYSGDAIDNPNYLHCVKCGLEVVKVRDSIGIVSLWSKEKLTCIEGQIKDIIE